MYLDDEPDVKYNKVPIHPPDGTTTVFLSGCVCSSAILCSLDMTAACAAARSRATLWWEFLEVFGTSPCENLCVVDPIGRAPELDGETGGTGQLAQHEERQVGRGAAGDGAACQGAGRRRQEGPQVSRRRPGWPASNDERVAGSNGHAASSARRTGTPAFVHLVGQSLISSAVSEAGSFVVQRFVSVVRSCEAGITFVRPRQEGPSNVQVHRPTHGRTHKSVAMIHPADVCHALQAQPLVKNVIADGK